MTSYSGFVVQPEGGVEFPPGERERCAQHQPPTSARTFSPNLFSSAGAP